MSTVLSQGDAPASSYLDLNTMTLVPAGSASHVPFVTYLARGRDADKPAVVVLVDGDEEGDNAVKVLRRGGPRYRRLLREKYIVQLSSEILGVTGEGLKAHLSMEDLIPTSIAVAAASAYVTEMGLDAPDAVQFQNKVEEAFSTSRGVLKAVQSALDELGMEITLAKLPFARHAVEVCRSENAGDGKVMRERFAALFSHLAPILNEAWREREGDSIAQRFDRDIKRFVSDYERKPPTRADLVALLDRLVDTIDDSIEGDEMLAAIRQLRLELELDRDQHLPIDNMDELKSRLESMKYTEVRASQSTAPPTIGAGPSPTPIEV